jgi:hypothetical protein
LSYIRYFYSNLYKEVYGMNELMNAIAKFAMLSIVVGLIIGTVSMTTRPASAGKDSASKGLEKADVQVHEHTGPVSKQDIRFHEGTCQGGHTTKALEDLGGCDILTKPGNSDNHRQDN